MLEIISIVILVGALAGPVVVTGTTPEATPTETVEPFMQ